MQIEPLSGKNLTVRPIQVNLYIPPMVWKGDPVGHIGTNDVFFYILEGECFLNIDSQYYIAHPGQLVFLPKGKHRAYTHSSNNFCMYEMAFSAEIGGQNLMQAMELSESDFLVDIADGKELRFLFENSHHVELFKNPVHDIGWCANILNMIRLYAETRQQQTISNVTHFTPVIEYMTKHLDQTIAIEELAGLIHMQPTYFIRCFKTAYGVPPIAYLGKLRLYKAMHLLSTTTLPIEQVAASVGLPDAAYFARYFKKKCGITPSEYRNAFQG